MNFGTQYLNEEEGGAPIKNKSHMPENCK